MVTEFSRQVFYPLTCYSGRHFEGKLQLKHVSIFALKYLKKVSALKFGGVNSALDFRLERTDPISKVFRDQRETYLTIFEYLTWSVTVQTFRTWKQNLSLLTKGHRCPGHVHEETLISMSFWKQVYILEDFATKRQHRYSTPHQVRARKTFQLHLSQLQTVNKR